MQLCRYIYRIWKHQKYTSLLIGSSQRSMGLYMYLDDPIPLIPTVSFQQFHSNSFIPTVSFQQFHSNSFIPTVSFQQFHSNSFIPTVSFQQFHSNSFIPTVSFQQFHSNCFIPTVLSQSYKHIIVGRILHSFIVLNTGIIHT